MIYQVLGNTGIEVSKICFGSLTMGPLQRNLSTYEGASLIEYAYHKGVNFLDTAELYDNYAHIKEALKRIPREKYVIASKCYAYSVETAEKSLEKALRELGTDYIDVFMLHEQVDVHTIRGHYEAIEYFLEMKQMGKIRAFGISTHYISGVKAAIKYPEIEVVHPILNIAGLGIQDGTREEMEETLKVFKQSGRGIFAMKPFGGGNLLHSMKDCFDYILEQNYLDSIAIGLQSKEEIDYNVSRVLGETNLKEIVSNNDKKLQIADWCMGCGACVKKCNHHALEIVNGKAIVDRTRCVLCGYCAAVCPEFCIKVY